MLNLDASLASYFGHVGGDTSHIGLGQYLGQPASTAFSSIGGSSTGYVNGNFMAALRGVCGRAATFSSLGASARSFAPSAQAAFDQFTQAHMPAPPYGGPASGAPGFGGVPANQQHMSAPPPPASPARSSGDWGDFDADNDRDVDEATQAEQERVEVPQERRTSAIDRLTEAGYSRDDARDLVEKLSARAEQVATEEEDETASSWFNSAVRRFAGIRRDTMPTTAEPSGEEEEEAESAAPEPGQTFEERFAQAYLELMGGMDSAQALSFAHNNLDSVFEPGPAEESPQTRRGRRSEPEQGVVLGVTPNRAVQGTIEVDGEELIFDRYTVTRAPDDEDFEQGDYIYLRDGTWYQGSGDEENGFNMEEIDPAPSLQPGTDQLVFGPAPVYRVENPVTSVGGYMNTLERIIPQAQEQAERYDQAHQAQLDARGTQTAALLSDELGDGAQVEFSVAESEDENHNLVITVETADDTNLETFRRSLGRNETRLNAILDELPPHTTVVINEEEVPSNNVASLQQALAEQHGELEPDQVDQAISTLRETLGEHATVTRTDEGNIQISFERGYEYDEDHVQRLIEAMNRLPEGTQVQVGDQDLRAIEENDRQGRIRQILQRAARARRVPGSSSDRPGSGSGSGGNLGALIRRPSGRRR